MLLKFLSDTHQYFLDDEEIPSTSRIVNVVHHMDPGIPADVLDLARDRGQAVAAAVRLYLDDDLEESELDEAVVPRLAAFKTWFDSAGFVPDVPLCELPMYNEMEGMYYGWTPDLVGLLKGKPAIIDLKCTYKPWEWHHGIQLAGYAGTKRPIRMVLNLGKDGNAKEHEFKDEDDFLVFAAALKCTWTVMHQAKPKRRKKKDIVEFVDEHIF